MAKPNSTRSDKPTSKADPAAVPIAPDAGASATKGSIPDAASSGMKGSAPGAASSGMKGSTSEAAVPSDARPSDVAQALDPEERRRRIADAAYYRAERRGFAPGQEEEDWLDAEKEVDRGTPTDRKLESNDFPAPK